MLAENFARSVLRARVPWHARVRGLTAHVVLGRRLRPFCYWHAAALDWTESPFADHGKRRFDLLALDVASAACTSVFPRINLPRRGLVHACAVQWRFARRLEREKRAFANYLADFNTVPVFGETGGEPASAKCPGYLLAVVHLMKLGFTKREAWMTPVAEGAWIATARAQTDGDNLSTMLDDEDIKMFREMGYDF